MVVDNGGFFPELDAEQDRAWFLMDGMKLLGTDAVGVSEKELRFGLGYLLANVKRTQLPMVSANLYYKGQKKLVFPPYLIKQVGGVKVGVFSLISDKVSLGPPQDSLSVMSPEAAARRTVAELRKKGVTVVLLLSQLGKVESEDLCAAVEGIDAVVTGHSVPVLPKGRMVKNTVAVYGGEQGQYLGQITLNLDDKKRPTGGDAETFILGAEITDKPEVAKLVKGFEDGLNEKLRKAEKEMVAEQQARAEQNKDHFLGADVCIRCHVDEGTQWKTTAHSLAWQTLVDAKKDATPECVACHVVGYKQPGGFQASIDAPRLANVQCENCHGMGTQHEAFAANPKRVTEQTCMVCHNSERDPSFRFDEKAPLIVHSNMSGQSIENVKKKLEQGSPMLQEHGPR
jgi:hypothetical protein